MAGGEGVSHIATKKGGVEDERLPDIGVRTLGRWRGVGASAVTPTRPSGVVDKQELA